MKYNFIQNPKILLYNEIPSSLKKENKTRVSTAAKVPVLHAVNTGKVAPPIADSSPRDP